MILLIQKVLSFYNTGICYIKMDKIFQKYSKIYKNDLPKVKF